MGIATLNPSYRAIRRMIQAFGALRLAANAPYMGYYT